MDLREKKTKRCIKNAFIQLRAHKPLERISVKELAELAEISKATFYLHYHDIFDLSDCLQKEVIQSILNDISQPELLLSDIPKFNEALFHAFLSQETLIDILFSGTQSSVLSDSIEKEMKNYIFKIMPEAKQDARLNILLTYQIQGGFHAFVKNRKEFETDQIMKVISEINEQKLI